VVAAGRGSSSNLRAAAAGAELMDAGQDADEQSTATVSDDGNALALDGPAAAAVAAANRQQAAAAGGNDADETGNKTPLSASSSETVTDEGLGEQEVLMQEVLQQVSIVRQQQRDLQKQQLQRQDSRQHKLQQQQQAEEPNYLGIPDNELTGKLGSSRTSTYCSGAVQCRRGVWLSLTAHVRTPGLLCTVVVTNNHVVASAACSGNNMVVA
jgi:hypothetical protein